MRLVLVAESFAPRNDEAADTARHLVDELLALGHRIVVITVGPGMATYRSAEVIRTRRLVPAGALTQRLVGFRADALLALSPRLLGSVALKAAQRLGMPSVAINAPAPLATAVRVDRHLASHHELIDTLATINVGAHLWTPGVDTDAHHPALRDEGMRSQWARGRSLVIGFAGTATKEKVEHASPGSPPWTMSDS